MDRHQEKIRRRMDRALEDAARDLDIDLDSDIPLSERKVKDTERRDI